MFSSQKVGELNLILDIQSSIVRGTLVHMQPGVVPLVLYTHNVIIPYKARAHSGYLIKSAIHAINQTVSDVAIFHHARRTASPDTIPHKISAVHYVLSSPWIVSQAKTLKLSFKEDTSIGRRYILGLIAEERSKLGGVRDDEIRVVEEKVFDVRLNGYSVTSWESRHTRDLEVSFVVSVAGGRMIDKFVEACDHVVHRDKVQFHSSLFLQHISIEKIMTNASSYALLHIHGELTDVAIVHSNSCTFFGSYPFGIQSIIRTIARETKTDEQSAESLLTMSEQGHLDGAHAQKELAVIEDMNHGWIGEFRKLLKASVASDMLPHQIIISAHSHESFFMKSFAAAYPTHAMQLLTMDTISPQVAFDPHAEQLRLSGLYVIAVHSLYK